MGVTAAALLYGHTLPPATQLAYVVTDSGQPRVQLSEPRHVCELTLTNLLSASPRATKLFWSPDGRYLVVQQRPPGAAPGSAVTTIDMAARQVICHLDLSLEAIWDAHWQGSGDGFLLVASEQAANKRVYGYVALADCAYRTLDTLEWLAFPTGVTWSAATGRFYLVDRRVRSIDPQTGQCSDLTDWLQADLYWSDDGTHLLQITHPAGCTDGQPPQISAHWLVGDQLVAQVSVAQPANFPEARQYDWSPDGTRILAFGWGAQQGAFCMIDAATLTADCVHPQHTPATYTWAWSPDSTQIAYVTGDFPAGDTDIALYDVSANTSRRLTDTPTIDEHMPMWSPDSRYLLVRCRDIEAGCDATRVIDATTGRTAFTLPEPVAAWRPLP